MSWTTEEIPPLDDKVAVVTGANGGLGLETARALARQNPAGVANIVRALMNGEQATA